jgi:hypothetical protein
MLDFFPNLELSPLFFWFFSNVLNTLSYIYFTIFTMNRIDVVVLNMFLLVIWVGTPNSCINLISWISWEKLSLSFTPFIWFMPSAYVIKCLDPNWGRILKLKSCNMSIHHPLHPYALKIIINNSKGLFLIYSVKWLQWKNWWKCIIPQIRA